MTFSLHKSTAMTDTQAANNKSKTLNVKGDIAADMASDGELSMSENSFSKLFSLFNSDNKAAAIAGEKTVDSTDVTTGESAKLGAAASIDDGIVAGRIELADEVDAIAGDDLSVMSQGDSVLKNESSDDFLARLDQSSMLLQGQINGNELPLPAKGANIASSASISMTGLSMLDSSVAETTNVSDVSNNEQTQVLQASELSTDLTGLTEPTDTITASTLAGMSTVAGLIDNNPRFRQDDLLVSGDSIKGDGTLDNELFDGAGKANLATGFGEAGRAKNTPFGQSNGMITEASSAVTKSDDSALEQLDMTSAEPIEQLDFAQIMESVRKQEPLDQTSRTLTKAPVLTDVEQQVLEKRVSLNNNLASSELNEKIAIMVGKELQTATIRLDPAELGSMNIKLVVQNDQINVTIQAQNNQSRDLLEQQMPRLREMLQQQGMTLGDTKVQADSGQQQSGFQQSRQENGQKNSNNDANYANYAIDSQTEVPASMPYWQDSAKGVDFYA
ncbi:flagellar hook-length control protein FliK [Moritella sp.]|uniref:flagellar hook-length control protein FliK n=1 Tax=Moritella sp. TaxID=78556 RepID=UPI001D246857|nr:flagellar hook-length control protein FliK [Moritella sp.]MCJ8348444.1 flagellar hook-length control protein FliK [Moritella sp.]NQZ38961.1 flagellar hook-length control protein FliK [Moritella sp.]